MTIKTRSTTKAAAKPAAKSTKKPAPAAPKPVQAAAAAPQPDQPITGRGVFAVRTIGDAVSVEAAFMAEDGNVLRLPAVFPNRDYALSQIDELRELVNRHFDELAAQGAPGAR